MKASPVTALLRALYICAVAGAVIPYGGVQPAVIATVALAFAVLAGTCVLRPLRAELVTPVSLAIVLAGGLALWASLQSLPIGIENPSWGEASRVLGPLRGTISIAPSVTLISLYTILTPVIAFIVGVALFPDDDSSATLARAMALLALAGAALGLYEFSETPDRLLFQERFSPMDGVTAFFVNRNTAAPFLGVGAMLWLAFLLQRLSDVGIRGVGDVILRGDDHRRGKILALAATLLAFLTLAVALFLTKSRMGVTSALLGLAVMSLFCLRSRSARRGAKMTVAASAASAAALVVTLTYLYGAPYLSRLQQSEVTTDGRWCFFEGMIAAIRERPLTGMGFGTLEFSYPMYRDPGCMDLELTLDRGHGGYLEIAMGMGVAGPAVLLAGALCLAWLLIRGAWMRRSRRFIPAAALGSLLLVLMHSGFDFPMQVTGLAVYAAAVFASGVVQSRPPRVKRSQRPTRSPPAAGAADEH